MSNLASAPVLFNVTLTNANTEYSQALPSGCSHFEMQARSAAVIRFAFEAGRVATPTAPYVTIKADGSYSSYDLWGGQTMTVYFASATAGAIVEIIAWR